MALVVEFKPAGVAVAAKAGTSLLDAATAAGVRVEAPCGGQGRCGRCKVRVESGGSDGALRYRSNARLALSEEAKGYRLCCQTFVDAGNDLYARGEQRVVVSVPRPGKKRLRQLGHAGARPEALPATSGWKENPAIRTFALKIEPPSLEDNTSDLDRLRRELARQYDVDEVRASLDVVKMLGRDLREADWNVSITVDTSDRDRGMALSPRVLATNPARTRWGEYGLAVDVGTTSVVVYLVQLGSGRVVDSAGAYNAQIACGDDVISRIVYSQRGQGLARLQQLVVETINELIDELLARTAVRGVDLYEMVAAGNTVMTHLLLGVDPKYLREEPYIPTLAGAPPLLAGELGLKLNPRARVHFMPSIGSWVGGDITAGVISSGLYATDKLTLFMDIGTNGEIVLGNRDWLIACACSAGPAFEGGGVSNGMRATSGAIEDIWIDPSTLEPTFRTIDDAPPQGLCGSGLIELLAELLLTGVLEKSGRFARDRDVPRLREGDHGMEYVVAWRPETEIDHDVVLTETDVNNLIRAKAAMYAGFSVLCRSVGVALSDVEQVLIGGAFGQYVNIEKAVQIGLLPDLPIGRFRFLGNTSALGAYMALLCLDVRDDVRRVADKMTYLELSADNSFMEEYTSALFLPHTDLDAFPSVRGLLPGHGRNTCAVGTAGTSHPDSEGAT
jgi:uncharacterized 2Fe-2S/4Fe-4S cluster protein (DUF4445 family)